ncbi:MAG: hypothetical protein HC898_00340 [Phycisphaerales bacterium]|nr:hypothetical protein [Phycisphaerales bacterium]
MTMGMEDYFVGYVTDPLKQLVYLNFDGGTTTQYSDYGNFTFDAFDTATLSDQLAGDANRTTLITGGGGVTGILANILTIFNTLPATLPGAPGGGLAQLVAQADFSDFTAAVSGLWFTTVNPSTQGLVQGSDYTTVYIGAPDQPLPGLLGLASGIDVAGRNPANEAIVIADNFAGIVPVTSTVQMLNSYSIAFANIIAHELGHAIGLNHQPTTRLPLSWELLADDPDNDTLTADDSNAGSVGLMAYQSNALLISELSLLGTAPLTSEEFAIGNVDTAQLLVWWFA